MPFGKTSLLKGIYSLKLREKTLPPYDPFLTLSKACAFSNNDLPALPSFSLLPQEKKKKEKSLHSTFSILAYGVVRGLKPPLT